MEPELSGVNQVAPSSPPSSLDWVSLPFQAIDTETFYRIAALRINIFVIEQDCPYEELDGWDLTSYHIYAKDESGRVVATARILAPHTVYEYCSIGRVVVDKSMRGAGIGRILMKKCLSVTSQLYPGQVVKIAAQQYLERFYSSLGFISKGKDYLWDGIPHVDMYYTP